MTCEKCNGTKECSHDSHFIDIPSSHDCTGVCEYCDEESEAETKKKDFFCKGDCNSRQCSDCHGDFSGATEGDR
jgi:hypothetical protein